MFMLDFLINIIVISLGGALGAESRYFVTGRIKFSNPIPYGTLTVNVLGSFLLGAFTILSKLLLLPSWFILFIATGFLGCFTTMSTFAVESLGLAEQSNKLVVLNIGVMLMFVLLGALLGETVVTLLG